MPPTTLIISEDDHLAGQLLKTIAPILGTDIITVGVSDPIVSRIREFNPYAVFLVVGTGHSVLLNLCAAIRNVVNAPIFAYGIAHDFLEISFLAAGADDVFSPSTSNSVLASRVEKTIRGYHWKSGREAMPLRCEDFELDPVGRILFWREIHIPLTRTEFDLMTVLMRNPTRAIHRDELRDRVWGFWNGDDHVLEVHMSRLRRKIVAAGGPRIARNIRGFGYRFVYNLRPMP